MLEILDNSSFATYHPIVSFIYFMIILIINMSSMNPILLVISLLGGFSYSVILSSTYLPPAANYAYIANFGRYYFIEGQRILPGNQIELSLKVDVLMSWKTVINDSNVIAIRSTNRGHKMIPDNIPIQAKRNVIYKQFTGGNSSFGSDKISADTRCYLLTVMNGGV